MVTDLMRADMLALFSVIAFIISTLTLFTDDEAYRGQGRIILGGGIIALSGLALLQGLHPVALSPMVIKLVLSIPVCGLIYGVMGCRKYMRSYKIDPATGKERVIDLATGDETLREPQAD
jgi:hypothetical protein